MLNRGAEGVYEKSKGGVMLKAFSRTQLLPGPEAGEQTIFDETLWGGIVETMPVILQARFLH